MPKSLVLNERAAILVRRGAGESIRPAADHHAIEGLEVQTSPQRPLRGHTLVHPVPGEVASDQVEVQRSNVEIGHVKRAPSLYVQMVSMTLASNGHGLGAVWVIRIQSLTRRVPLGRCAKTN